MGTFLARATRRITLSHIQYVAPVTPRDATGLVSRVYDSVERDFGMLAPPVSLHSPAPEPLAASWMILRETLIADSPASRAAKEAIAAAVSAANTCPYCVDVHGATLVGLLRGQDSAAVVADRLDDIADPELRAVARWARSTGVPAQEVRHPAAFPAELIPDYVGVAVTFHYYNRMVNVFLPESPVPTQLPDTARRRVMKVAARLMGTLARRAAKAGTSLSLLPPAPLTADLAWAAGRANIATAFAAASAAVERAGERAVPPRVRQLILDRLRPGADQRPGLSPRPWLDEATAGLPEEEVPAARLALLIAFASYQVSETVVNDFRALHPGDDTLVEFASWVAFTVARHIGTVIHQELRSAPAAESSPADGGLSQSAPADGGLSQAGA